MKYDSLQEIIETLSKEDVKNIPNFLKNSRKNSKRLYLKLFSLLTDGVSRDSKEIQMILYGKLSRHSYYHVRKKLFKLLNEFILQKQLAEDNTQSAKVNSKHTLAKYLFKNGKHNIAWQELLAVEKMAQENDLYAQLIPIYQTQIAYADKKGAPELQEINQKRKRYTELYEEEINLQLAVVQVQKKLKEIKVNSPGKSLKKDVKQYLKKYGLENAVAKSPKMLYQLMSMTRSLSVVGKNYLEFEEILLPQIKKIGFNYEYKSKDHRYVLELLYMTAHVLYRNRKFDECLTYLFLFNRTLHKNKSYFQKFYPKWVLLKASVYSYQGKNLESIELIEEAIQHYGKKMNSKSLNDMKLNLAVYYFQLKEHRKCKRALLSIRLQDKTLIRKMGKEWLIRKKLISIINEYEKGDVEFTYTEIHKLRKQFGETLSQKLYARVDTFLGFILDCIKKPEWVSTPDFFDHVNSKLERWPLESEDIQAMAFYCWLKAKMLKREYYEVLVETVGKDYGEVG